MSRILALPLVCTLLAPAAFADDGEESRGVCILEATETITSPKKPNLHTMKLNCGSSPSEMQTYTINTVKGMENEVDAVQAVLALDYDIASSTTRNEYTGNSIITTYVFVEAPAEPEPLMVEGPAPEPTSPEGEESDELDVNDESLEGEEFDI